MVRKEEQWTRSHTLALVARLAASCFTFACFNTSPAAFFILHLFSQRRDGHTKNKNKSRKLTSSFLRSLPGCPRRFRRDKGR